MVCRRCSGVIAEGHKFCGFCGARAAEETLTSVSERVTHLEERIASEFRAKITQRNLEIETAERVMARVRKWTTLFLYFGGIPAAITALALAVIFGKGAFSLNKIAANAQTTVNEVLTKAQSQASSAAATANAALNTSEKTKTEIQATEQAASKLRQEVELRTTDVSRLNDRVKLSEAQVERLNGAINSESLQVQHLTTQVQQALTSKNSLAVENAYPIFGKHVASNLSRGWIDPKQKVSGVTYLNLSLSLTATPTIDPARIGEAMASLNNHKFYIFLGHTYVYAVSPSGSSQPIGMGFDENSCMYWPNPASTVPCIFYFSEGLRDTAIQVQNLLRLAQAVPDTHIILVDPKKLTPSQRETMDLSHMDIVVVLGQQ